MAPIQPLSCDRLFRASDPTALGFETTTDLEPAHGLVGQDRALAALEFGVSIKARGFNIFALGAQGSGRHNAVRRFVEARAKDQPDPDDWVYMHNFAEPYRPKALRLPSGLGVRLAAELEDMIVQLKGMLPAMFEAGDYRDRQAAIDAEFEEAQQAAFRALGEKADAQNLRIVQTPTGMMIVPVRGGEPIKPEVIERMAEAERNAIQARIKELGEELTQTMRTIPGLDKERRQKIEALNREVAELAVGRAMDDLPAEFHEIPDLAQQLNEIRADLVGNAQVFLAEEDGNNPPLDVEMNRYRANPLLRSVSEDGGAPVIYADAPDVGNLVGRIEHIPHMGAMLTDFTQIKPGALHRANGGYLLVDAERLLTSPMAWQSLKRCLRAREIVIAPPSHGMSTMTAVTLEPAPVPLDLKVVLFGSRMTLHLVASLDPDFSELFKVAADFDDVFPRTPESERQFCCLITGISRDEAGRPLTAGACSAVIERAARLASDAERVTLRVGWLADLIREADHWAAEAGASAIDAAHITKTVDEQTRRIDLVREKMQEQITRETVLIDTDGQQVGQINGLAVLQAGYLAFGKPNRITARVRMGTGKVVDIEREVEMGGPLHSKGVLILSGFLAARYAQDVPVSLSASLVFEQSYGGVDGDSASSTELYALLSALSGLPIRQGLAVTGSVNQNGEVQAIGGVNEKIEGFYDICAARGLTGDQGCLVPEANVKHLMLRQDVVEACRDGRFHVYSVAHIDQGIEILTGHPAGERGTDGLFPEGSVNRLVEDRLTGFAEARRRFGKAGEDTPTA
ncbi:MAG: AAA family ATPase [Paracoccaceae bacterium]|nr:AAA family ATPase [Paracoccaceae bacterium]